MIFVRAAGDVAGDEFCEWEAMNITCQPDEIIVLKSARYGRMRAGRCVSAGYGNMGCSTDVTSHIDKLCSGRRQCYMEVSALQRLVRPCPKDLKSYLEVKSTCIKGKPLHVKNNSWYIVTTSFFHLVVAKTLMGKLEALCLYEY